MNAIGWTMSLLTACAAVAVSTVSHSLAQTPSDAGPGTGALLAHTAQGDIPLPLTAMDVELTVTGNMVRGVVTQSFNNTASETIDAVYVFPLPEHAAVDAMTLRAGDREIVAEIQERGQARATYEQARAEGRKASLVEQDRPNLFRTSVAGLAPGETVAVRLEYLEEIAPENGTWRLVFPLTFTARYTPSVSPAQTLGGHIVPAAESSTAICTAQRDAQDPAVPRARVRVRLEPGAPVSDVLSPSHTLHVQHDQGDTLVEPDGGTVLADRDFVLTWKLALAQQPNATLLVEERNGTRYGLLVVFPPAGGKEPAEGLPTETLFVIDVSGSMEGSSIRQAKRALTAALDRLQPGDTFGLLAFNNTNWTFRNALLPADRQSLAEGRAWVDGLSAGGGTEIRAALDRAMLLLAQSRSSREQRIVLITDGAVEDEAAVFADIRTNIGRARLHVVGIGDAPNSYLMRKAAEFGHGACRFIGGGEDVGPGMAALLEQIDRPVLADVTLDWKGSSPQETFPQRLPDLYAGQPLIVSLSLPAGHELPAVTLTGRMRGGRLVRDIAIDGGAAVGSGIATRFARAKVDGLLEGLHEGQDEAHVRDAVLAVAREFHLVTPYTSLVAVEHRPSVAGPGREVQVPSGLPAGSLPQTGTLDPLIGRIALLLLALGGLGLLVFRPRVRARVDA